MFVSEGESGGAKIKAWEIPLSQKMMGELNTSTTLEGTSGVYLLNSADGEAMAVFKPKSEEYLPEEAASWGLVLGQGFLRERAAFLVSEALGGYSAIPHTSVVKRHDGIGSLQRFVPDCTDMSDLGPSGIPVGEVHKIALLDLLLCNMDRHEGNILLRPGPVKELIPIDHALCLPELVCKGKVNQDLMDSLYFAWQTWPQAKEPWSDEAMDLMARLSVDTLAQHVVNGLGEEALSACALTTLKIGLVLARACMSAGMTPYEIAEFFRSSLASSLESSCAAVDQTIVSDDYEVWEQSVLAELDRRLRALNTPITSSLASSLATEDSKFDILPTGLNISEPLGFDRTSSTDSALSMVSVLSTKTVLGDDLFAVNVLDPEVHLNSGQQHVKAPPKVFPDNPDSSDTDRLSLPIQLDSTMHFLSHAVTKLLEYLAPECLFKNVPKHCNPLDLRCCGRTLIAYGRRAGRCGSGGSRHRVHAACDRTSPVLADAPPSSGIWIPG